MNLNFQTSANSGARHSLRQWLLSLGLLAALTLALFGDVLFAGGDMVLSAPRGDLFSLFVHWRRFGFEQLAQGNLALWNPHVFSGAPFFGGFHAALLYPPNAIFLLLPLAPAINWSIAGHVFLAGAFMYAWVARRRLHPLACLLAAVMFMLGGAHFLHVHAGHLPHLCAMVWVPLIFLAVDALLETPATHWWLLGAGAVAMQVLAGFPQYVFYTAIAVAIYATVGLFTAPDRVRSGRGLAALAMGGAALSAVQLFTSFMESRETLRSVGLSFEDASMFGFPPENVLTLLAPDFFGGFRPPPYWGRCYLWETSLFVSVTGLVFALAGMVGAERNFRRRGLITLLAVGVLALGNHTPLFAWLYETVPGFDKFRGASKFMLLGSLFLALFAGAGMDALLRRERAGRRLAVVVLAGGGLALAAAAWVWWAAGAGEPGTAWHRLMATVQATGESYVPAQSLSDEVFVRDAAGLAARELSAGGVILLLLGGIFWQRRITTRVAAGLVGLALVELLVFAHGSKARFEIKRADAPELQQFRAENPGDYRILDPDDTYANATMSLGMEGMWGYEPNVPLRYVQFMAFTQGVKPDAATQYLDFKNDHRLYAMLRRRFVFLPEPDGTTGVTESTNQLPHLLLVPHCRVLTNRDTILAAMAAPEFDPRREVILETAPWPAPVASGEVGTVRLVQASTDWLDIEADVKSPSILLITDSYATGWRARALPGSMQTRYELLPANWCLRAVPLAAGHHRLRVEYVPAGFVAGKWVSVVSVGVFFLLTCGCWWWRQE